MRAALANLDEGTFTEGHERKMASLLSEADYQPVSSGDERWWNAICWERADLVREGLFRDYSERGVWELSEKGKSLVRDMERSTD
jgi:hypothetical protein